MSAALVLAAVTAGCSRPAPSALAGARYEPARVLVQRHCGPCHTAAGRHERKRAAYPTFQADAIDQWQDNRAVLVGVLSLVNPDGKPMPPPDAPSQPSADERRLLLEWTERGSPNTPDGRCPGGAVTCRSGF